MPNMSFHAGPEVRFSLFSINSFLLEKFRQHAEFIANLRLVTSNRPDVQSQHPGAGTLIQGPGGGMGPGQDPPSGGAGRGGFHYK